MFKTKILKIIFILFILSIVLLIALFAINSYIKSFGKKYIIKDISQVPQCYTVIVPGAFVYSDGTLSDILHDRVLTAYNLYKRNKIKRFLLSGDHGTRRYDEVNAMLKYLKSKGVKDKDIFTDHAGFRTYDTMLRALKVFKVDRVVIVTQKYHLYRAIYIARKIGLKAYGFASDLNQYTGMQYNEFREFFARIKAFFDVMFGVRPKYLGEVIPITGDSRKTRG